MVVGSRRAHTPTRKWPAACLGPVCGARAPADATSLYAVQGLRSARSRRVLTGSCGRLRPRPPREQQAAELAAPPQLEGALRPEPRPQAAAAAQVAQSTPLPVALARPKGTRGPVVGTVSVYKPQLRVRRLRFTAEQSLCYIIYYAMLFTRAVEGEECTLLFTCAAKRKPLGQSD